MIHNQANLFLPRQTNTGLYVQLHQLGFSSAELREVQRAYRLACRMFNGRYRKTERAFICHAVGAASATAQFDQRLPVVLTAMLHATYDSGQFPDGRNGKTTEPHRKWLADQVGAEIEGLLFSFASFDFEKGVPEQLANDGCREADRDNLLVALAHEIDDMADGGLILAPKYGCSIESRVEACVKLAHTLDNHALADSLQAHGMQYADTSWADDLQRDTLRGYQIAPNAKAYYRLRRNHWRGKHVELH